MIKQIPAIILQVFRRSEYDTEYDIGIEDEVRPEDDVVEENRHGIVV